MNLNFKYAFMAIIALILGLTSCSTNGNGGGVSLVEEHNAVLNITLDNPKFSKAVGTAPSTDNTVNEFSVFVINENGDATWKTHVTGAGPLTDFEVTTAAKRIYVIANAGDQTANYNTKAQLEAAKLDLDTMYSKARWATGNSTADLNFVQSGNNWTATESLALQFIAARITVKINNQMENYDGTTPGSVILNKVMLLNARGESKLFPGASANLIPTAYGANKKFLAGMDLSVFAVSPAAGEYAIDATNLADGYTFSASPATSDYYFYAYENEAATTASDFPTIVTLVGTDVNGNPVYFPIHLATYETWKRNDDGYTGGIERGKSYDITITLTGDAKVGNGGGTDDPTAPVINATVNLTISITDWVAVSLEKVF